MVFVEFKLYPCRFSIPCLGIIFDIDNIWREKCEFLSLLTLLKPQDHSCWIKPWWFLVLHFHDIVPWSKQSNEHWYWGYRKSWSLVACNFDETFRSLFLFSFSFYLFFFPHLVGFEGQVNWTYRRKWDFGGKVLVFILLAHYSSRVLNLFNLFMGIHWWIWWCKMVFHQHLIWISGSPSGTQWDLLVKMSHHMSWQDSGWVLNGSAMKDQ